MIYTITPGGRAKAATIHIHKVCNDGSSGRRRFVKGLVDSEQ
ncbi:hypothetical protein SAMN07250955_101204 [Arboricoccus pini]|uniref:Uncharacterized protein n=1 Tax=Arboricoccus pini TaxID=1963835 RepID=A0A212PYY7_9PROT|nr:hypothetical protein [Arboricoccus pini]SNB52199.1 hypothetical protein SAMN07250955_101204 [Arboricoccus pini]